MTDRRACYRRDERAARGHRGRLRVLAIGRLRRRRLRAALADGLRRRRGPSVVHRARRATRAVPRRPRAAPPSRRQSLRPRTARCCPAVRAGRRPSQAPADGGMLFDVRTGAVLWQREPDRAARDREPDEDDDRAAWWSRTSRPSDRVLITRAATHFSGSGVGLLPQGKRVPAGAAVRAAAPVGQRRRDRAGAARRRHPEPIHRDDERPRAGAGSAMHAFHERLGDRRPGQPLMRRRAGVDRARRPRATRCWRGSSPPAARSLPFPIKGGKLYLYNNNPLLRVGYPGTDGVKTGFTDAAGHCLVAAARRGPGMAGGRAAALGGHARPGADTAERGVRQAALVRGPWRAALEARPRKPT